MEKEGGLYTVKAKVSLIYENGKSYVFLSLRGSEEQDLVKTPPDCLLVRELAMRVFGLLYGSF